MFKWLEQYFTFSRTERNAIVVLLALILLVLIAPRVYLFFKPVEHTDQSKYQKQIESFLHGDRSPGNEDAGIDTIAPLTDTSKLQRDTFQPTVKRMRSQSGYFQFDPNKIGVEQWMRLGFTEKQAESIEKYKAKGGKFYRPQDLMRLYVMDEEHYYKLKPFVKIDVDALPKRNYDRY